MDLFQFNLQKPELRARWYARAVQILSGKDEALRTLWPKTIWGSAWNPSTAPMWRVEADPGMVDALRQIEKTGSPEDQKLASDALQALAKSPPPVGAANGSQPIRPETNSTPAVPATNR